MIAKNLGAEVSDYTARKFPDFLKAMDLWKEGKIGEALAAAFIQFDEHLTKEEVIDEIRRMAGIPKKEEQTGQEKTTILPKTTFSMMIFRWGYSRRKSDAV